MTIIYLKVKPEAHDKLKESLDKEVNKLNKVGQGAKGWVLRRLTGGVNPLVINYTILSKGEFKIKALSVLGDFGFYKAMKRELEKDFKTDIIDIHEVKE